MRLLKLPTEAEINPDNNNLDGAYAVKHFLGRSLREAELLFCDHQKNLSYFEDLWHMGPKAFCYYIPVAFSPFLEETEYWHSLRYFGEIIRWHLEQHREEIKSSFPVLQDGLQNILDRWDTYDEDDKRIWYHGEDLYSMYVGLLKQTVDD